MDTKTIRHSSFPINLNENKDRVRGELRLSE